MPRSFKPDFNPNYDFYVTVFAAESGPLLYAGQKFKIGQKFDKTLATVVRLKQLFEQGRLEQRIPKKVEDVEFAEKQKPVIKVGLTQEKRERVRPKEKADA